MRTTRYELVTQAVKEVHEFFNSPDQQKQWLTDCEMERVMCPPYDTVVRLPTYREMYRLCYGCLRDEMRQMGEIPPGVGIWR